MLVIRGYMFAWWQSHPIDWTYSHHCLLSLSKHSPSVAILKLYLASVVASEFLVIVEEIEQVIMVTFVMKGNWLILFLKEGKEHVPVIKLGQDEDMLSGTFMCFRVVTGDVRNGGRVARWLETLRGLHHAS